MSDEPPALGEAINGYSGLYPRHKGGNRYAVLSLRNGGPTRHWVTLDEEPTCTCEDYSYNQEGVNVCDHIATAEAEAPKRIDVSENLVGDLSLIVRDLVDAAETAQDAAGEFEGGLVAQRSAEADSAEETDTEATDADVSGSVSEDAPSPPEAAETLREAFAEVVEDMQVEVANDLVWVKTGFDTPDNLDVPGKPDTWETLIKNPEHLTYVSDDHRLEAWKPGEYFKNVMEPGQVESYISEVLE